MGPDNIVRQLIRIEGMPARVATADPQALLPHLVLPAHHDVRPDDIV
jgi:hypothetical protein